MKVRNVVIGGLLLGIGAGCSTRIARIPIVPVPELKIEALTRADYRVIGPAQGEATASAVFLFPLPICWVTVSGGGTYMFRLNASRRARDLAMYNAVESVPNADAMLTPRFKDERSSVFVWYTRHHSVVTGKAIEIKAEKP